MNYYTILLDEIVSRTVMDDFVLNVEIFKDPAMFH